MKRLVLTFIIDILLFFSKAFAILLDHLIKITKVLVRIRDEDPPGASV